MEKPNDITKLVDTIIQLLQKGAYEARNGEVIKAKKQTYYQYSHANAEIRVYLHNDLLIDISKSNSKFEITLYRKNGPHTHRKDGVVAISNPSYVDKLNTAFINCLNDLQQKKGVSELTNLMQGLQI